jgi:hypothetical protein
MKSLLIGESAEVLLGPGKVDHRLEVCTTYITTRREDKLIGELIKRGTGNWLFRLKQVTADGGVEMVGASRSQ